MAANKENAQTSEPRGKNHTKSRNKNDTTISLSQKTEQKLINIETRNASIEEENGNNIITNLDKINT